MSISEQELQTLEHNLADYRRRALEAEEERDRLREEVDRLRAAVRVMFAAYADHPSAMLLDRKGGIPPTYGDVRIECAVSSLRKEVE